MTDYTELKRLAEAATAGPWKVRERKVINSSGAVCGTPVFRQGEHKQSMANADYIASASPDVVLSMLAEIDRLNAHCIQKGLQLVAMDKLTSDLQDERDSLRTQNQALLLSLKAFVNHGTCFDDTDMAQARAAIKLAVGGV